MEKKRLFILKSLEAGGAETYLLRYLNYDSHGRNVVLCMAGNGGSLECEYEKVADIEKKVPLGLFNPIQYLTFYRYIKKHDFDVVCAFMGNFSGWIMLCASLAGINKRITFYRESRNQFKPTLIKTAYANFLKNVTSRYATRILSNSYAALEFFHPQYNDNSTKYRVIYNGFDKMLLSDKSTDEMRDILKIPHNAFVIGHTGRLAWAKNHDMIIDCAIDLCHRHSDLVFVLVGREVDSHYKEKIKDEELEGKIRLLGYRPDVMDVLKAFDLFYFPSLTESQPNALIEAMCSGIPFVASDIPPIREAIPSECIPYLVDPNDRSVNLSILEKAYRYKNRFFNYPISKWAIEKYDNVKCFNMFKEELL